MYIEVDFAKQLYMASGQSLKVHKMHLCLFAQLYSNLLINFIGPFPVSRFMIYCL